MNHSQNGQENLHYELSGGTGLPVLLLLHGFMGSGRDWKDCTHSFRTDYRCLTVDLPGHGGSCGFQSPEMYSMESTAAAVIAVLQRERINSCFMAGYSMGGRLGLFLTVMYPEYFTRVVIESASPGIAAPAERSKRLNSDMRLAVKLESGDYPSFLKEWYSQPLFESLRNSPGFDTLIRSRRHNNPAELAQSLCGMSTGRQPSLWERCRDISIPVLVLVGEYDTKYRKIADEMLTLNGLICKTVIPRCGHAVHVENKKAFISETTTFFMASEEAAHGKY